MPDGHGMGRRVARGEDIVDRLRRQVELIPGLSPEPPEDDLTASDRLWFTVQDAADEIENLTAALARANALLDAVADDIGGDYLDVLAQEIAEREGTD